MEIDAANLVSLICLVSGSLIKTTLKIILNIKIDPKIQIILKIE